MDKAKIGKKRGEGSRIEKIMGLGRGGKKRGRGMMEGCRGAQFG